MELFKEQTNNGYSKPINIKDAAPAAVVSIYGDWGKGSTVKLQHSADEGVTWVDLLTTMQTLVHSLAIPSGKVRAAIESGTKFKLNARLENVRIGPLEVINVEGI